ncbi:MAG: DUF1800 domain-containing protein [Chitinophagales bacterium]|nr:DUF1800 domain-containing protein [Chitinophagales bacterium]
MITEKKKINHLLWRAGFGPSVSQLQEFTSKEIALQTLFRDSKNYSPINIIPEENHTREDVMNLSKEEMKGMRQETRRQVRDVSETWVKLLFKDENALREKMSLFWHGHLACRPQAGYHAQQYANIIRNHALGNFGNLLTEVSKSPAMMKYLDSIKNKKDSPNENFARELMELFTLGNGNYSEQDVKNAARAFTGWSIVPPDQFVVRTAQHDEGDKEVFGIKGDFSGDEVIQMILEKKQTALHVTSNIYKFFVNEKVNEKRVNDLAISFYESGYNIEKLMKEIFYSEWFYDEENIGVKIKSPIELLAGIVRTFKISANSSRSLQIPLKVMGQELLYPPNVAGWPGGKNWMDGSSLMYRLNLADSMFGKNYEVSAKSDVEEMMHKDNIIKDSKTEADWNQFIQMFASKPEDKIFESMSLFLIQPTLLKAKQSDIDSFTTKNTKQNYILSLAEQLLLMPEYQMC